jgi:hypothetical protein
MAAAGPPMGGGGGMPDMAGLAGMMGKIYIYVYMCLCICMHVGDKNV